MDRRKIVFRGAFIRMLDVRQGKEGGEVFCRIHMSAEFSDVVREAMEWEDPGESVTSAKLTGELLAEEFALTPGDKNLKGHELQIAISDVSDFQVVALKDDEGEPSGRQLRFIARSPGDGVEALVGQYIRRVGRHEGQLSVAYLPAAKQLDLPGASNAVEKQEVDGQEPIAEFLQGEALEQHQATTNGPALVPASSMGGTHQRGTRGRRPRDREREAIADGTAPLDPQVEVTH